MGEAAVKAAKWLGYEGAGTIEFIFSEGEFYFMEMNTRLQVEHPVTEAITGIDLVEWQLRVAAGEALPLQQDQITLSGHAFEARLYAEDVEKGFLPATGTLSHLRFPQGARIDSGVRAGDTISPFYDPMIAKVITHGPARSVALSRLTRALEGSEVAGSVTNLAFLAALTRHTGFAAGDVDTGLIERDLEALVVPATPTPQVIAQAALEAAGLAAATEPMTGFTLWAPPSRRVVLAHGEAEIAAEITSKGADRHLVEIDGTVVEARREGGLWAFDGARAAPVARKGDVISVFTGPGFHFALVDPLARAVQGAAGGNLIEAPMPGLVKAVFVAQGERVAEGQPLAVLEAMKMEHTLTAGRDGIVAELLAEAGAQVEAGAALIRLEEEEEEAA